MAVAWRCRAVHNGRQPRADSAGQQMARRLDTTLSSILGGSTRAVPPGGALVPGLPIRKAPRGCLLAGCHGCRRRCAGPHGPNGRAASCASAVLQRASGRGCGLEHVRQAQDRPAHYGALDHPGELSRESARSGRHGAREALPVPRRMRCRLCALALPGSGFAPRPSPPACVSCRAVAGRGALSGSLIAALARAAVLPSAAPVCCLRLALSALPPPPPPVPPAAVCPRPPSSTGGVHQGRDAKPEA